MTIEQPAPELVADLLDEAELADMVEAALEGRVALVPVTSAPVHDGLCELHLRAPGVAGDIVVSAVLAGEPMGGMYPFLLQPVSDKEVAELEAFVAAVRKSWLPRQRSMVRASQVPGEADPGTVEIHEAPADDVPELDALIGRTLGDGRYQIQSLIGEGGMGRVYEARHVALEKQIAIKVLHASRQSDPELAERFHQEALAASKLDHPNVMQVTDFGEEPDGLLYIAMELLSGRSLSSLLEEQRRLSLEKTIEIVTQVCSALAVAHERGIVHRDMKPDNVVLVPKQDEEGSTIETVKVCDFGLAKIMETVSGGRRTSMDGTVKGTPEYMSPEQARGESVDARTDLYACGVILYELITGTVPFTADTPIGILTRHVTDAPRPPRTLVPGVHPDFEAVILKAMEKDREQRFQSARELREGLRAALMEVRAAAARPWYEEVEQGPPPATQRQPPSTVRGAPAVQADVPPASRAQTGPSVRLAQTQATLPQVPASAPELSPETAAASTEQHRVVAERHADALAENPAPTLLAIDKLTDPARYAAAMAQLARVMQVMAERAYVESLWQILNHLDKHAKGAVPSNTSREGLAAYALHSLKEPEVLEPVARTLFTGKQQARESARGVLVAAAGAAGAEALCRARVAAEAGQGNRPRFVAALKEIGPRAAPAIARALARLTEPKEGDQELAEDLLRAVPAIADKELAAQVSRFVTSLEAPVRRAAVGALTGVAGNKAVDQLVTALADADEGVRVAALAGLRRLGAVTREVVEQIGIITGPKLETSEELRAAALAALADVKPDARAPAFSVLMAALEPRSTTFVGILRGDTAARDSGLVVETAAAAMLKVGGAEGRKLVERRMNASKGEVKERLAKLLR